MNRVALRTQMGPMPPRYSIVSIVFSLMVFYLAYSIISYESEKTQPTKEMDDRLPSQKIQEPRDPPIPEAIDFLSPSVKFDLPLETQTDTSKTIEWLIDISRKEDNQLTVPLTKKRQELMDKMSQENRDYGVSLDSLFRKNQIQQIQDLDCLKHKKFTSPALMGSGILGLLKSLFTRNPYEGVEAIFFNGNSKYWRSEGNRLTVFSTTNISPYYVKLLMLPQADNQRVSLFGLRIEEDKIAVIKTFTNYYLGSYDLADCDRDGTGSRYLNCVSPNCNGEYTFLMLIMEKVGIAEMQLYGKRAV